MNQVRNQFLHSIDSRNDVADAHDVYRNALQAAANQSITIASIG